MAVTGKRDWREDNPDVLDFQQAMGCQLDVDESGGDLREGPTGPGGYSPPRYEYSYYFNMTIHVNSPWFDEIKFRLNDSKIDQRGGYAYREAQKNADEIKSTLEQIRVGARAGPPPARTRAKTASSFPTAAPPPCRTQTAAANTAAARWPDG